jgi:hypothetical protein
MTVLEDAQVGLVIMELDPFRLELLPRCFGPPSVVVADPAADEDGEERRSEVGGGKSPN